MKENKTEQKKELSLESEYKIGHTTYTVRLFFNFERGETLEDVIQRLILKDAGLA
ncbi:MAG: transposon-encoded TnpW family protein [Ruminococcus sp.]|nr:transposon-encoded TnpW family protein [Ruminococcus sp.]